MIEPFISRFDKLPGSSRDEVFYYARKEHQKIQKLTKRRPYVRSQYFGKDKIFLDIFWNHLVQKHRREQMHRAKFYLCAIDLLRNTKYDPETIISNDRSSELLHRFTGKTKSGEIFYVQVKQNKRNNRKDFMSVFPTKKSNK